MDPSSPNAQLLVASPVASVPSRCASLSKTCSPPGPVANRCPCASTFIPSGRPFFSGLTHFVASKKTRPFAMEPSGATWYAIQIARCASELAT